ncbi:MAG: OmpH family outer membrane protein [Myxococcales bacterium]|nr:OmpH family outer membrane protein [Myxococcales bacterium]
MSAPSTRFIVRDCRPGATSRLAALIVAALGSALAVPAFAGDLKVAIVDLQVVLKSTKAGKAAQGKFDDLRDKKKRSLETQDKALQKRQKELVQGRMEIEKAVAELQGKPVPDDLKKKAADFQDTAKKFEQDVMDFEKAQRSTIEDLGKKEAELLRPIEDMIRLKVEAIAKEKAYTLVLTRQVAVFADPALDITPEVIKRCDGP